VGQTASRVELPKSGTGVEKIDLSEPVDNDPRTRMRQERRGQKTDGSDDESCPKVSIHTKPPFVSGIIFPFARI
jgi:hypothetical protein